MRTLVLAAVTALLATACGDDGSITVHGRLLQADGSPAAGYGVSMYAFDLAYDPDGVALTDAEGRYELSGHMHALSFDDERLAVTVVDLQGETRLDLSIPAASGDHSIPDQRLWDDQLATTPLPDGDVRATWNVAPVGSPGTYVLSVYAAGPTPANGPASWRVDLTVNSQDLPPDLFEDRFASLQLSIGDDDPHYSCQKDLCVKWLSTRVDTARGSLVPVSRGASCSAAHSIGPSVPLLGRAGAPCALTDGYVDYLSVFPDDWVCGSAMCTDVHQVTVDLGAALPVQTIVVRYLGLYDDAAFVEISTDGTDFTPVATVDQSSGAIYERVHLDAPVSARFVRITPSTGGTIAGLAELSAF